MVGSDRPLGDCSMDSDLIAEIDALREVAEWLGLQLFRSACHDGWVRELGGLPKSPLFRCCTPSGREEFRPDRSGLLCGCLMEIKTQQIRGATVAAWTDVWTEAIRHDVRIPIGMASIYPVLHTKTQPLYTRQRRRMIPFDIILCMTTNTCNISRATSSV